MAFPSTVRQIENRVAALANNRNFRPFCQRFESPKPTHVRRTKPPFLRIGTGTGGGRHRVLIVSGIHAREFAPPDAVMTFVERLLAAYHARGPLTYPRFDDRRVAPTIPFAAFSFDFAQVRLIVEELELYVLPLANPDGRAFAQARRANNLWRKNRRPPPTGSTCTGVDINRNFDVGWDFATYYSVATIADLRAGVGGTLGVSDDPCSDTYHGPAPPSGGARVREPETENIVQLLNDKNIDFYVDVHSAAAHILFPWGLEQNQENLPEQTFLNPDFDVPNVPGRDAAGTAYKEWMPPGSERLNRDVAEAMNNAILDSTGFTAADNSALALRARANSDYAPVQSLFLFGPGALPDFEPGASDDFAFSRQIGATPGPNVRAFARDPIVSLTFECGRAADGDFHPHPTRQYPKVEREVGAGLFAFALFAAQRRGAVGVTTTGPTLVPVTTPPPRPPPRKRRHMTSAYEFQSTGILLAGAGEHDVRVLGAARETEPPLPPAMKEEIEPAGDPSVYERYFEGDLTGEQEDPEAQPFHPRVPALFVSDRGEPFFLERDWGGVEIALADIPVLPDARPDGGLQAPPGPGPSPPGPGPSPSAAPTLVPLFRPTPANPLAANAKLQAALNAAVAALETKRSLTAGTLSVPFAIAELTNTGGTFPFAGHLEDEMDYIASLAKVEVMYAAFAVKDMAQRFADAGTVAPADLFTRLVAEMNPPIRAVVPEIASATNLQNMHREPGYQRKRAGARDVDMLVAAAKTGGGSVVSFTPAFTTALEDMIVPSSNDAAARCVHGVGYGYMNGALAAGGLFDRTATPAPGKGLWEAGDFQAGQDWPAVRLTSTNDGPAAQLGTTRQMVKLVALIFAKRLLDTAACDAMLDLLHKAAIGVTGKTFDQPFIDRPGILPTSSITHNKLGLGPLTPRPGRPSANVLSEATVLDGPVASSRKYVVAWQNLADPGSITLADVATLIRDTITEFEKP